MAYWLSKSEPETWSWDDQLKEGEKGTHWDGVRVIKERYPDHTDESERFGMVGIAAVATAPSPVTLADVKGNPELSDMVLANNSRLSVQPVQAQEWKLVCRLLGLDPKDLK